MPIYMEPKRALEISDVGETLHVSIKGGGGFRKVTVGYVSNIPDDDDPWLAFISEDGKEILNDSINQVRFG